MTKSTSQPGVQEDLHRDDALEQSAKEALQQHPDGFKDEATAEKVVEIGPELTADPIKGIDPAAPPGR